ncbi:MAG: hypothetical protein OXQ28_09165 [Acidobacteriota bacterium]|nr:hypothetical protein [Acidobacteriota bacterium]
MTETTAIVVSIVGTGIGIIGVIGLMLRILTTNISKQFETNAAQMRDMKTDLGARIDDTNQRIHDTNQQINGLRTETNRRFETLTTEMHQRFDRVHQELAENRERMAKLEGSLDGFLAGRRDRDAA